MIIYVSDNIIKMSNKLYNHDDLEFRIIKRNNVVKITCDDVLMYKSYEEYFIEECIIYKLCLNNLNNFYNIMCHSFENKMVTITVLQDKIELSINAELSMNTELSTKTELSSNADFSPFVFRFDITLFVTNENQMYVTHVNKLKQKIEELEENMLVPLCIILGKQEFVHAQMNNININMDEVYDMHSFYFGNLLREYEYDIEKKELTITFTRGVVEKSDFASNISSYFKTIKTKNITFTGIITQLTDEQLQFFPQIINDE